MYQNNTSRRLLSILRRRPDAWAGLRGTEEHVGAVGIVRFYQTPYGVLVCAEVAGLPRGDGDCDAPIFGFHVHEVGDCGGNEEDPFANVGGHYNPHGCRHPYHAGDLPPLFGADGYAISVCLTDRFAVDEIVGRSVIVHAMSDDFTTQPSGMSGKKIACGVIRA
ncbi:MAG: superoxide dismutase family protein [Clostridia bacterium]|nr:superoxide dismutase family protein [Clostridia bacterium]